MPSGNNCIWIRQGEDNAFRASILEQVSGRNPTHGITLAVYWMTEMKGCMKLQPHVANIESHGNLAEE
jgi:hypothetical protein